MEFNFIFLNIIQQLLLAVLRSMTPIFEAWAVIKGYEYTWTVVAKEKLLQIRAAAKMEEIAQPLLSLRLSK